MWREQGGGRGSGQRRFRMAPSPQNLAVMTGRFNCHGAAARRGRCVPTPFVRDQIGGAQGVFAMNARPAMPAMRGRVAAGEIIWRDGTFSALPALQHCASNANGITVSQWAAWPG